MRHHQYPLFENVKHKYRVTYDSSTDGVFTVHNPGQQLHFVMHNDGLHYHDTRNREITLVQTMQETEEGYSQRQIQDSKKAHYLYVKVGYPSARDFKNIISNNLILNCPVTASDAVRADKIYGYKYRVTYDSSTDGVFTVHKPGQQLHFVMHKDGLHYHDTRNREITLVITK